MKYITGYWPAGEKIERLIQCISEYLWQACQKAFSDNFIKIFEDVQETNWKASTRSADVTLVTFNPILQYFFFLT